MLIAFYPSVTLTSLRRAFEERPSYFAGGVLIGRTFDALRLPDGRIFDIVFAAWTSSSRWQALDVTNAPPREDDPFPLDEGPLTNIDVDATLPPIGDPVFESLVAARLGEVGQQEERLGGAAVAIATGGAAGEVGPALDAALDEARFQHWQHGRSLDGESLSELTEKTDGLAGQADANRDELPPPPGDGPQDIPPYDPGPSPEPPDTQPGPEMPRD